MTDVAATLIYFTLLILGLLKLAEVFIAALIWTLVQIDRRAARRDAGSLR